MPFLSATLIVRDEERHVGSCLSSIEGLVDEIVVVDTGSRDRTREIAKSHGARVIETVWDGDFSAARNLALDHARGEWALYIDADERASGGQRLRETLADPSVVAGLVQFRVQAGFTRYWEYRLFRIDPAIRFRGVIHETMVPDIVAQVRMGRKAIETDLSLDHLGYEGDLTAKYERDLPLLERAVRVDPGRVYLWHALAVALLGLGDPERAEEAWTLGFEALRRSSDRSGAGLALLSAMAEERHRAGRGARECVEFAATTFPDHPLTWWMFAREALVAGRPAEAVPFLERLTSVDPEAVIHARVAADRRIFRESAYELLGTCWLQLGDAQRAAEWLRRAEAETGGANVAVRLKRELAESRAQAGPALHVD